MKGKLKSALYVVLGFGATWILSMNSSLQDLNSSLLLLVLFMVLHEALHYFAAKTLRAEVRPTVRGLLIGFQVKTSSRRRFVAIALAPQILTLLALVPPLSSIRPLFNAALLHVVASLEDLRRVLYHVIQMINTEL